MITDGIYFGMSHAEYRAEPALSSTSIGWLLDSPATYKYRTENYTAETDEMRVGSIVHAILDGTVDEKYELTDLQRKGTKEWVAAQQSTSKQLIKKGEYDEAKSMADSAMSNEMINRICVGAEHEVSVFWTDEGTGLRLKARIDLWNKDINILLDWKTCKSSAQRDFSSKVRMFNMNVQAALYCHAIQQHVSEPEPVWMWCAIEREPPHVVGLYEPSEQSLLDGMQSVRNALQIYQQCSSAGAWPANRSSEIIKL